jgi:hypothetical protein
MRHSAAEHRGKERAFQQAAVDHQRVRIGRRIEFRVLEDAPAPRGAQGRLVLGQFGERLVEDELLAL